MSVGIFPAERRDGFDLPGEDEYRVDGIAGKALDAGSDMFNECGRLPPLKFGNQPRGLVVALARAAEPNTVATDDDEMRWRHVD